MEIEYSICKTLHEVALRHSGSDVVENGEVGPQSVRPPGYAAWARDLPIDCLGHAIYASINRHKGHSLAISWTIGTRSAKAAAHTCTSLTVSQLSKPDIAALPFRRTSPLSRRPEMHHDAQSHYIVSYLETKGKQKKIENSQA